jgi:hypothetical protein
MANISRTSIGRGHKEIVWLRDKNDKVGTPIVFENLTKTGEFTWSVKIAYTDLQAFGKKTFAVRAITTVDGKAIKSDAGRLTITPWKLM